MSERFVRKKRKAIFFFRGSFSRWEGVLPFLFQAGGEKKKKNERSCFVHSEGKRVNK